MYARLCENGQGSAFQFETKDGVDDRVDVSYSTFWNDFSHYSFHLPNDQLSENLTEIPDTPIDYSDLIGKETTDLLFADKTNYITDHESVFERDCSGRAKVRN